MSLAVARLIVPRALLEDSKRRLQIHSAVLHTFTSDHVAIFLRKRSANDSIGKEESNGEGLEELHD